MGWEMLPQTPYSSGIAPFYYFSLQRNFFNGKKEKKSKALSTDPESKICSHGDKESLIINVLT